MCGIPPFQYTFFCAVFPPLCHIWFCLGFQAKLRIWKVPACKMKQQIVFCVLLGPSWIINLAQPVSPSLVLPVEIVSFFFKFCEIVLNQIIWNNQGYPVGNNCSDVSEFRIVMMISWYQGEGFIMVMIYLSGFS